MKKNLIVKSHLREFEVAKVDEGYREIVKPTWGDWIYITRRDSGQVFLPLGFCGGVEVSNFQRKIVVYVYDANWVLKSSDLVQPYSNYIKSGSNFYRNVIVQPLGGIPFNFPWTFGIRTL
jgi:hypothetical protein